MGKLFRYRYSGAYSHRDHYVVAESYAEAERLITDSDRYNTPIAIAMISDEVLLSRPPETTDADE